MGPKRPKGPRTWDLSRKKKVEQPTPDSETAIDDAKAAADEEKNAQDEYEQMTSDSATNEVGTTFDSLSLNKQEPSDQVHGLIKEVGHDAFAEVGSIDELGDMTYQEKMAYNLEHLAGVIDMIQIRLPNYTRLMPKVIYRSLNTWMKMS